jgi:hypothetical protein
MSNITDKISLLEVISSSQIDDLICEYELLDQGYKFYYTVDNFEISKYCFPGNLDGEQFYRHSDGHINFDLESEIVTAYDYFFKNITPDNPVIFLNEYLSELVNLRLQIIQHVKDSNLFDYSNIFTVYLNKFHDIDENKAYHDFTLFIAVSTGIIKNGAQRYNQLLMNPYFIVNTEDNPNLDNIEFLKNVFQSSAELDKDLSDEIFKEFVKKRYFFANRFSKRIDSEAIARVIQINNELIKKYANKKLLFLFLSSAESSSTVISEIGRLLPVVNSRPFNFHRTAGQLFIKRLIDDLPDSERSERLRNAREALVLREQYVKTELDQSKIEQLKEIDKLIVASFKDLRDKYVSMNLARQFQEFDELFGILQKFKKNKNIGGVNALYANFKNFSEKFNKEENLKEISIIENAFKIEHIFNIVFKKSIFKFLNGKPIVISRGGDIIMSSGQHMPIVFRYDEPPQNNILNEIAELYLNQFVFLSINYEGQQLVNKLSSVTTSIYSNNFYSKQLSEKLIFCLYLLILPKVSISPNKFNSQHVEEFLLDVFNNEMKDFDGNALLYSDYLYVISWVLRRNEKYKNAMFFCEQGITKFPEDARFYHSRFLINICLCEKIADENTLLDKYYSCLWDIKTCQQKYESILIGKTFIIQNSIRATLLNSEIYRRVLITSKEKKSNEEKLSEFTQIWVELKKLKQMMGDGYNDYPEFLHTESVLEFHEGESLTDREGKIEKLESAIKTLTLGIDKAKALVSFRTGNYEAFAKQLISKLAVLNKKK